MVPRAKASLKVFRQMGPMVVALVLLLSKSMIDRLLGIGQTDGVTARRTRKNNNILSMRTLLQTLVMVARPPMSNA